MLDLIVYVVTLLTSSRPFVPQLRYLCSLDNIYAFCCPASDRGVV
jgi:hypothetical protein